MFYFSLKFSITKTKNLNHVKNAIIFTNLMLTSTTSLCQYFFNAREGTYIFIDILQEFFVDFILKLEKSRRLTY